MQYTNDFRWIENPSLSDYHYNTTSGYIDYELANIQRQAIRGGRTELQQLELNYKGIGQAGTTVIPAGGRYTAQENSNNNWVWRNQLDTAHHSLSQSLTTYLLIGLILCSP